MPRNTCKGKQPALIGLSTKSDNETDAPTSIPPAAPSPVLNVAGDPNVRAMNLRVLQRFLPTTQSYTIIANIASVYQWGFQDQNWGEAAFKGVLFLCHMQPAISSTGKLVARESLFLHNRLSPQNLEIDLESVIEINRQPGEDRLFTIESFNAATRINVGWGLLLTDGGDLTLAWENIEAAWTAVKSGAEKTQE